MTNAEFHPRPRFDATSGGGRRVRLGFVPLIDAASVIVAHEMGYFADEHLDVVLSRELGWANIRDKLAFGRLDASPALIGLPIRAALHDRSPGEPIRSVMSLGTGGDAITVSRTLHEAGVTSAVALGQYVRQSPRGARPLVFAHVFESSVHHYLLREWLVAGDLNPDLDVRLCVLPPPQMPAHLAAGHIDGFCSGEPWNTLAASLDTGRIAALASDLVPAHPDKVLAVNERWAEQDPSATVALVRAILRGSRFCADPANVERLAAILARPRYVGVAERTILASLRLDRDFGLTATRGHVRPAGWQMRSFDATFPSVTHAAWLVSQMQRWGHVEATADAWSIAERATDTTAYRLAAHSLGLDCPATDAPPMRLRDGTRFDRSTSAATRSPASSVPRQPAPVREGVRS